MEYENLIVEMVKDKVCVIRMNRPDVLNAMDTKTLDELSDALKKVDGDERVSAVIVTGTGKAFIAGADIRQMANLDPREAEAFALRGQSVFMQVETMDKPVIAAINGYALGAGIEFAMACDIRLASNLMKDGVEVRYLGQPEVKLGIIPGFGGTQRMARLIGKAKAKELILTGDPISAREACSWGLVNKVVDPALLMDEAIHIARKINQKGPEAIKYCKKVINEGLNLDFKSACDLEAKYFGCCFETDQPKEGISAFLEKRKPVWKKEEIKSEYK